MWERQREEPGMMPAERQRWQPAGTARLLVSQGGRAGCSLWLGHELPGWLCSDEDAPGRHSSWPELPARGKVPRDLPTLKRVLTVKILQVPVTKINPALYF